tara:strand:- start:238 stop:804 length:567 start_codon:yes stop_codon:yes gene_type:complete
MNHVWNFEEWKDLSVKEVRDSFLHRSTSSPCLGKLTVDELCCLAGSGESPVGIYVFSREGKVMYVGKTHGRSLHERMISHIDHRDPVQGSPHLAQFVSSLLKNDAATSREQAVHHILNMQMTWLPIPDVDANREIHKKKIAIIERRLLWQGCLNPRFNSLRVRKNPSFMIKGVRYHLTPELIVGSVEV